MAKLEVMEEPTLNEDEMVGFIMRNVYEVEGVILDYNVVRLVLDAELAYMIEAGIAGEADTAER